MENYQEERDKGNLRISLLGCVVLLAFLPVLCILGGAILYTNPGILSPRAVIPTPLPPWSSPTTAAGAGETTRPTEVVTPIAATLSIPSPTLLPAPTETLIPLGLTPEASPTFASAEVRGCVEISSIHVRARPRSDSPSIDFLLQGECARLLARNPNTSWVQIKEGWISVYFLRIEGDLDSLPVVAPR